MDMVTASINLILSIGVVWGVSLVSIHLPLARPLWYVWVGSRWSIYWLYMHLKEVVHSCPNQYKNVPFMYFPHKIQFFLKLLNFFSTLIAFLSSLELSWEKTFGDKKSSPNPQLSFPQFFMQKKIKIKLSMAQNVAFT